MPTKNWSSLKKLVDSLFYETKQKIKEFKGTEICEGTKTVLIINPKSLKPITIAIRLRYDYDTTTTKIDMFIFCSRRIASNGEAGARFVVVGS